MIYVSVHASLKFKEIKCQESEQIKVRNHAVLIIINLKPFWCTKILVFLFAFLANRTERSHQKSKQAYEGGSYLDVTAD